MSSVNNKLVIIGIDGATFDIILPMVKNGELPTLGKLIENGVYGELNSTIPPMTPPAWSSFATGLNPGKHGIYDFTERVSGTYSIRFVNASMRNGKCMWTISSEHGKRVAVMAVPFTYPPEEVNGVMISGIDAPGVGAQGDTSMMYPRELYHEIEKEVGRYIVSSNPMNDIYKGEMESALNRILTAVERKGETAKYLLSKDDWDQFVMVFGETDLVGHHFWKYYDPDSPFYEESSDAVKFSVQTVYKKIDTKIGEMLDIAPEGASVMIVSDHGFGGNNDIVVHLNNVLEEMGLLKFNKSGLDYIVASVLDKVKKIGLRLTPPVIKKELIKKQRGGLVNKMESKIRFSMIDWSKTSAFSEETPYFPSIWVNLKGREPGGIVSEGEEYNRVVDEIIKKLKELKDPFNNCNMINAVYRRDEIYSGESAAKSPDIIIDWNTPGGYSYISRPSLYSKNGETVRKFTQEELRQDKFRNKSGNHRQHGIFIGSGGAFLNGDKIENAQIIDIAPTALYIQGVPIPETMDGTVLNDTITSEFKQNNKLNYSSHSPENDSNSDNNDETPYTEEESEIIQKRLQDLGYID